MANLTVFHGGIKIYLKGVDMGCNKEPIAIYQGFGTKWDNNDLLAVTFNSEISITGFGAEFIIGDVVKSYTDIQNGFSVNLTAQETGTLPLGPINGTLVLIDLENNKRPFSTQLPFLVKDWAGGDIKLDGFKITINANVQSNKLDIDIGTTNPLAINEETIRGYIAVHNQDESAHTYIQDRITANTEKFAEYRTSEDQDTIDATFETSAHAEETYATKTELSNGLSGKQDTISDLATIRANALAGKNASTTISEYGNIVTHSISEFATAEQGALAETALQPGDNVSELDNDAGYITGIDSEDVSNALGYTPLSSTDVSRVALTGVYSDLSGTPTIGSGTLTIQKNGSSVGSFSANATTNSTINITVPTNNSELLNGAGYITGISSSDVISALGYTPYNSTNPNNYQTSTQVSNAVDTEASLRESADNNLQSQIDAVTASSDVKDIVGTYADLENYDTSTLGNKDIIKVLQDETHSDETTYYRWSTSTDSFSLIGEEGPYYTKSEANNTFVPVTRTVNGKGLYENITLTASDVGALPDSTVIPTVNDATLTIQKNGSNLGTFTANASVDKTINVIVPTQSSDIGAVEANTAITGATKCKITYDSKGLVTSGADLQASDIPSLPLRKISDVTATASEVNILDGITASTSELNILDGVTATTAEINVLDGITANTSELNVLAGITASTTELNYVDGVTSNIQTQLNGKVSTSRTINSKALTSDITLDASDVGALPDTTTASDIGGLPDSTKYGADLSYSSNTLQLLDQDGNDLGNPVTIQSSPDIDGKSITTNVSDELQTIGVIDQNNTSTALKEWSGTSSQYQALVSGGTVDSNTIYNITDDTNPTQALLEAIYPVGAIYIGTMNICPISALFGTWALVGTKILVDIPSTLRAKGTGKAMGWSDGTTEYGSVFSSGTTGIQISLQTTGLGVSNGTTVALGTYPTDQKVVGLTTDATKSEIVADTNATALTVNIWQRTE